MTHVTQDPGLKADTHSRITRAVLYGRVVRPCNTGAIRVTLSTRVLRVMIIAYHLHTYNKIRLKLVTNW